MHINANTVRKQVVPCHAALTNSGKIIACIRNANSKSSISEKSSLLRNYMCRDNALQ